MTIPPTPLTPATAALPLAHIALPPRTPPPPAGARPPLLLLLHGVGSHERDLLGLAPHLPAALTVVSARSPLALEGGGYGWYPVRFTPSGAVGDTGKAREGRDLLESFVAALPAAYGTDPARTYLLGFSQGAVMSLYVALTRPGGVAGVAAMSGRLLPAAWEERAPDDALRGLSVLAVHGLYDNVLPVSGGREIRDRLQTLPLAGAEYREYPMGHEVSADSLADVAGWLAARVGPQV